MAATTLLITEVASGMEVGVPTSLSLEAPKISATNAGNCHFWTHEAAETVIQANLSSRFTEYVPKQLNPGC